MREYSTKIALLKNKRGCYSLDPIIGCYYGIKNNPNGCYGECYAAKYAKRYGYKFGKSVLRKFSDDNHLLSTINRINNINDMPFVRMGTSGDPSENWEHTINILNKIKSINKPIVIVTKHWTELSKKQLNDILSMNVCINTSISALDGRELIDYRYRQYIKLRDYCNSVLRVVTCKFDNENKIGGELNTVQENLLTNYNVIDNVLRVSKNNKYLKDGIINAQYQKFMAKTCLLSKHDNDIYTGLCYSCPDMCGISFTKDYI